MEIEREMQRAEEARRVGNQGKARVCARRAAGWAIGAWRAEQSPKTRIESVLTHLQAISDEEAHPPAIQAAAEHLTLRITAEHLLPVDAAPLEDAQLLIEYFLNVHSRPK